MGAVPIYESEYRDMCQFADAIDSIEQTGVRVLRIKLAKADYDWFRALLGGRYPLQGQMYFRGIPMVSR
jgi:hypothetical protein